MRTHSILYFLALGFLILGVLMAEVEARRKILRGRKTITRHYYSGLAIPAWSIVLFCGLGMLTLGGGLYILLRKFVVNGTGDNDIRSYHPAMQDEV
ncbi:uncharacterized protein LOC107035440 [Diachasma alloeum]|uniref:uncharacterized protein LOC107035440 n=1 Tax=Diachasma alloeum TaxID=454923 RepID=UPI000738324C|nr:uncharacterized protein LOC107035440 [Diachasma alloeum]